MLAAVVWDFDGTLADTRAKNLRVTRRIVTRVTGRDADEFPALASPEAYAAATARSANWRELYRREFGMSDTDGAAAADLWASVQIEDRTPVRLYPGIAAVLEQLAWVPQGIVSQNGSASIRRTLASAGVEARFSAIVGYEDVDYGRQKPEPDGLLKCVEQLTGRTTGCVLYVGDHETDARCAARADALLRGARRGLRVYAVGALYGGASDASGWAVTPTFRAWRATDIVAIVRSVDAAS